MKLTTFAALGAGCALALTGLAKAQEWEESSSYYEDDAWYDISEWFDGNDYNPTDEQFGVIDDEVYDAGRGDGDNDSDLQYSYDYDYGDPHGFYGYDDFDRFDYGLAWYGYDDDRNNDWFYDWYDDGYASWNDWDADGLFDSRTRYFDYDDDGVYDAMLSQYDLDADGVYEDSNYLTFSDNTSQKQERESRQSADESSESRSVEGNVERTKEVSQPNGKSLVVELSTEQGSPMAVDLGPADRLTDLNIEKGGRLEVSGPMSRIGKKRVLMARTLKFDGTERTIDRSTRQTRGTVASTHTTRVGNRQHLIALLEKDGNRLAVDLGNVDDAQNLELQEGDAVTVFGPRVKVQDRTLLMAQKVKFNGSTHQIHRGSNDQRMASSGQTGNHQTNSQRGQQTLQQSDSDRRQAGSDQDQNSGRSQARTRRTARFTGEIEKLRQVNVRDSRRQIAELRTRDDKKVVIDLGPADQFEADIQEGDQLAAAGLLTRSGETMVLVAFRATANGQQFPIAGQGTSQRRQQQVEGQITRLQDATIRNRQRRMATIENENGQQVMVDLGRRSDVTDLQEGDEISARGFLVRNGDQRVLVATQVSHDGETIRVGRPDLSEPGPDSRTEQDRQGQESSGQRDGSAAAADRRSGRSQ